MGHGCRKRSTVAVPVRARRSMLLLDVPFLMRHWVGDPSCEPAGTLEWGEREAREGGKDVLEEGPGVSVLCSFRESEADIVSTASVL
ncbi:hypothetical protein NDU88_000954 [Pleurodeles waltl]|uniref:Uncharacterized protein n=1 Tax=Pleurodeles waltl TaxID=8319 RepID=A0AAV7MMB3_PLEWA|nr:hypothetical protein NDU88_000954 [Pleurodeles waltl]